MQQLKSSQKLMIQDVAPEAELFALSFFSPVTMRGMILRGSENWSVPEHFRLPYFSETLELIKGSFGQGKTYDAFRREIFTNVKH